MPRKDKASYNAYMKEYRRNKKVEMRYGDVIRVIPEKTELSPFSSLSCFAEYILKRLKENLLRFRSFLNFFH